MPNEEMIAKLAMEMYAVWWSGYGEDLPWNCLEDSTKQAWFRVAQCAMTRLGDVPLAVDANDDLVKQAYQIWAIHTPGVYMWDELPTKLVVVWRLAIEHVLRVLASEGEDELEEGVDWEKVGGFR